MLEATNITNTGFSIDTIVMLVLYFIVGVYAIFTWVLYYHWKTYGTDAKITGLTMIVYFATTIPLMLIMITMALII